MEVERNRGAVRSMQALEAIGGTGDHEARLARRQIIDAINQTRTGVMDRDPQFIALVHEQRLAIGRKCGVRCAGWSSRASGNSVHLNKGEIRWLCAVRIAEGETKGTLSTVDMQ